MTFVGCNVRDVVSNAITFVYFQAKVDRLAAQNEASRLHAVNVDRLRAAEKQNKFLRHIHSQAVADQRRKQYNYLRTQGAVIHNERVALTKDYMKISDYFEEVTDSDDEEEEFDEDEPTILNAEFDETREDEESDFVPSDNEIDSAGSTEDDDDYDEHDHESNSTATDQWSNVVNVGDEESYSECVDSFTD